MKSAVILFPGTNRERDMAAALRRTAGREPLIVWHGDADFPAVDLIVLPGGFSFGDYLRSGAIAARSPVMPEVVKRAREGVHVLGVCNGFQTLCEAGLLPGVLMRNASLKFVCRDSFAKGRSRFDYPLSSRFDEMDAVAIFDDVEIPRERVFLSGDTVGYSEVIADTGWRGHIMHQAFTRAYVKLLFAFGIGTDQQLWQGGQRKGATAERFQLEAESREIAQMLAKHSGLAVVAFDHRREE